MIYINKEKCTGCKQCVYVCPQVILQVQHKKVQLIDSKRCMECGACRLNCAYGAIELCKGTGCLVAIIKEDILKIAPKNSGCSCGFGV